MFSRIVSNLPFSPALIGQLGSYARELRREESVRRLGLIFTALAVMAQSFAILSPPPAQAAAHSANIIYEGIESRDDLLRIYDIGSDSVGNNDIRQIFTYLGISRADIENIREASFGSRDFNSGIWSLSRASYDAGTEHEQEHKISDNTTVYARKLWRYDTQSQSSQASTVHTGLVGNRSDGSWFAVAPESGNIYYSSIPVAPSMAEPACKSLSISAVNRTAYRFMATTDAQPGSSIAGYDFTVTKTDRSEPVEMSVDSSATQAWIELELPGDGAYTAKVTIRTPSGSQNSTSCEQNFTVSPDSVCPLNSMLKELHRDCRSCSADSSLWYKHESCAPNFVPKKRVQNTTQKVADAEDTTARPGDRLEYTLSVKNTGSKTGEYRLEDDLTDVLEYADILHADGGTLTKGNHKQSKNIMTWGKVQLKPGQTIEKTVIVQVKSAVPATPQNISNPESYNCVISNSFGNSTHVTIECPLAKSLENVAKKLPPVGTNENLMFGGALILLAAYFYIRSRLLNREVRAVRKEFSGGAL